MANDFKPWVDNPTAGQEVQSTSVFASDAQRIEGFKAGDPASALRVNSALRQANLVVASLMQMCDEIVTLPQGLGLLSTVTQVKNAIKAAIDKLDTTVLNTAKSYTDTREGVINEKITDLQSQVTTNKSTIDGHTTRLDNIDEEITALEGGSSTLIDRVETLETTVDDIPNTYALLPTSVTNTSCASGQWAVSAAAGPGTYLIGTFNVYDSNIHLKISGGIATSTDDNTTDAEVFISVANYVVNKAVCFANKLYTTSTRTGLYYTIDSSHNLRIFAPIPNYGRLFISAEITGSTIVGKGDGSLQSPSGGEYIETNYYFATDPSKLKPSTANGWTQTTVMGSLPSSGVYMVSFDIQNGGTQGTGILFFDGRTAFAVIGKGTGTYVAYYNHTISDTAKWYIIDSDPDGPINAVYYKRIA